MTDRELMQEAWEALNLVLAPFPVDDQRCLRVARMLEKRLAQPEQESQRQWRGLTDEDIAEIAEKLGLADVAWVDLMQAIERRLKKRNT